MVAGICGVCVLSGCDEGQALVDQHIDYILVRWHQWASAPVHSAQGYPAETPYCRLYRVSRQYDDANGALDAALDSGECEAWDALIQQMPDLERLALSFEARNLCSNAAVWNSPRLPADRGARAALVLRARDELRLLLIANGLWSLT